MGRWGVPLIGCHCDVCTSDNPHNNRLRPSALLTYENGQRIMIDCGPDFRMQALRAQLNTLDGLVLTHAHHDHTAGIEALRIYYARQRKPLPCLLSKATHDDLMNRFNYIFDKRCRPQGLVHNSN